ncbi:hypothetical protein AYI69_g8465 [Smittium culicis]|uniref:Uncharacterized protein n=1 Tax=Smittium culicis TaxID=133412 RepID=A0A1R1XJC4_9FUNG|nr:hypothetical protein AYI69_g8465 [Smittium culicis]
MKVPTLITANEYQYQARNWSEIQGLISPFGNTHRSVEPASEGYTSAAQNTSATKPTINTPPKNETSEIGSRVREHERRLGAQNTNITPTPPEVEDRLSTFRNPRKDSQQFLGIIISEKEFKIPLKDPSHITTTRL